MKCNAAKEWKDANPFQIEITLKNKNLNLLSSPYLLCHSVYPPITSPPSFPPSSLIYYLGKHSIHPSKIEKQKIQTKEKIWNAAKEGSNAVLIQDLFPKSSNSSLSFHLYICTLRTLISFPLHAVSPEQGDRRRNRCRCTAHSLTHAYLGTCIFERAFGFDTCRPTHLQ